MKTIKIEKIIVYICLIIISFFTGMLYASKLKQDKDIYVEDNFDKITNSIFLVETYKNNNKESEGTAFVYKIENNEAFLLTNEHVIKGEKIIIRDDNKELEASLLGKDKYLDIAVLKVKKGKIKDSINFSEEEPKIGEKIYVIGNPLGEKYIRTITTGILSGKNRMVKTEDEEETYLMKSLQTDAAINHGSSGSPMINQKHEVIGVITQKLIDKEIEGMGFAIPIDEVKKYLPELEEGKKIIRPSLGIKIAELSNSSIISANNISIPNNIKNGVVVIEIEKNSNAINAKLKKGDIITKINDTTIKDSITLKYEIYTHKLEDTIKIKYIRNNKEKETTIKLT